MRNCAGVTCMCHCHILLSLRSDIITICESHNPMPFRRSETKTLKCLLRRARELLEDASGLAAEAKDTARRIALTDLIRRIIDQQNDVERDLAAAELSGRDRS